MYESSCSQFFRTTTGIQSGLDGFDESRFIMTFLTILTVAEILCNFRLVLKQKTCRDTRLIQIRVLRKVFSQQFCFTKCRRQHLQVIKWWRYSRFIFVKNTISYSTKVPRAKFLKSDGLFCLSRLCKFGSFKNPFAKITSLSEFYFRFRRFVLLVKRKKNLYELWQQHKQLKIMEMSEV